MFGNLELIVLTTTKFGDMGVANVGVGGAAAWIAALLLCGGSVWALDAASAPTVTVHPRTGGLPVVARSRTADPVDLLGTALPRVFSATDWASLTPEQRVALRPLAAVWKDLGSVQRRKWITLGSHFAQMTPEEQAKLHARMTQWVALTPQQREDARRRYAQVRRTMPAAQRSELWATYQALSPEEKQRFAKQFAQKSQARSARAPRAMQPGAVSSVSLPRMPGASGVVLSVGSGQSSRASAPTASASIPASASSSAPVTAASAIQPPVGAASTVGVPSGVDGSKAFAALPLPAASSAASSSVTPFAIPGMVR
ncbi:hypothetical protein Cenrod_0128 [Candidatus Symbiobacter mobilis CR]|uniref:Transmembrane protein n=1 Tax=Candidatus Symbiobacter mobilis CR TaxID=946483 RepID=U5N4K0_9BURK|nr:hypothetical protein Cenrod_0128 [Candidatus Symbiobacter mobilis CR]